MHRSKKLSVLCTIPYQQLQTFLSLLHCYASLCPWMGLNLYCWRHWLDLYWSWLAGSGCTHTWSLKNTYHCRRQHTPKTQRLVSNPFFQQINKGIVHPQKGCFNLTQKKIFWSQWLCVHTIDVNGGQCCLGTNILPNISICVLQEKISTQSTLLFQEDI